MFSSFFETARNSPFRTPLTAARCDAAAPVVDPQPVEGRQIAAAAAAVANPQDSCEFGSTKYFALCGIGGILSCGTTHTFVVPLDLVKCRLQVDQAKYKNLFHGFKVTVAEEGARGLAKGWFPTLLGYSAQVRMELLAYIIVWRRFMRLPLVTRACDPNYTGFQMGTRSDAQSMRYIYIYIYIDVSRDERWESYCTTIQTTEVVMGI